MKDLIDFLRDWQTLVAGGLALFAAGVTVRVMMRQVRIQKSQLDTVRKESEEQRQRRLIACRAVMPADLSSIIQYAHSCALTSGTALRMVRGEEERGELSCPSLPGRVVSNLQQLIEQLDEQNAHSIADLLACYQIQYARLVGEFGYFNSPERLGTHRIITEDNIEFTLEQTVRLFLLAESMFKFARREEQNIPVRKFTKDQVQNALSVLELSSVITPDYSEHLERLLSDDNGRDTET